MPAAGRIPFPPCSFAAAGAAWKCGVAATCLVFKLREEPEGENSSLATLPGL